MQTFIIDYQHCALKEAVQEMKNPPDIDEFLTYLKKFDANLFDALQMANELLINNQIVAMPSDTVYGIFMTLSLENAQRLITVRKRDENKPFLVTFGSNYNFQNLLDDGVNTQIVGDYWPGKNTLIFTKNKNISYPLGNTIALRCPSFYDNPVFYTLLNLVNLPLLAPSLNYPGQEPLYQKNTILDQFGDSLSLLLFAADCIDEIQKASPSSIYDISDGSLKKLR